MIPAWPFPYLLNSDSWVTQSPPFGGPPYGTMRNSLLSAFCSLPSPLRGFILIKPKCCCHLPSLGSALPLFTPCCFQLWFPMVPYRDDAKQRSNHKPQALFLFQKRVRPRLAVISIASLMKEIHLIRCLGRRQLFYSPNLTQLKMWKIFFLLISWKPCGRWPCLTGGEIKGDYCMREKVQSTAVKITQCLGRRNHMRRTLKRSELFSMERQTAGGNTIVRSILLEDIKAAKQGLFSEINPLI